MELNRKQDDDHFWQRLVLPEEDRRRLFPAMTWTGSYRWFRSTNVIDLWRYRNSVEKARICAATEKKPRLLGGDTQAVYDARLCYSQHTKRVSFFDQVSKTEAEQAARLRWRTSAPRDLDRRRSVPN